MTNERIDPTSEPTAVISDAVSKKSTPLRSIAFLTGVFAGGNLLSMFLRMAGGALIAKACEPSVLGRFNAIGLVLGYVSFLQLGVLSGFVRELPYFYGKGDVKKAHTLASAAQAWALLLGSVIGSALLLVALWQCLQGRFDLAAGWAANAVAVFVLFYGQQYLQFLYRTYGDFSRLAVLNVIQNCLGLALVGLVFIWGFYGLCARVAILSCATVFMLWYWRPLHVSPSWDGKELKHLLMIGAPIFISTQIHSFWPVLDATLVFRHLDSHGLGLYSLVIMASQAANLLPLAVSQIIYPRMVEEYGRTGKSRNCLRMAVKPTLYLIGGMLPLVTLGWILCPRIISFIVPKYVEAIPAVRLALLASMIQCVDPLANIFAVTNRMGLYTAAILIGMMSYYAALNLLISNHASLVMFPLAMIIGQALYMLSCLFLIWRIQSAEQTAIA